MKMRVKPQYSSDCAVKELGVLLKYIDTYEPVNGWSDRVSFNRVNDAAKALCDHILSGIEAACEPVEREFLVTVETRETRRFDSVVTAVDEREAGMKAVAASPAGEDAGSTGVSVVKVVERKEAGHVRRHDG